MEQENSTKVRQTTARMKTTPNPRRYCSFANSGKLRLTTAKCHERLFHGGNTGSNPVGDANFRAVPIVLAVLPDGIRTHTTQRKQQQTNDPPGWILSEIEIIDT